MRTLKEIKALYDTKQPSKEKDKTTQTPGLNIKSADEKRFADKHVIQKIADRNGNGDDVFNATNVNGVERSPKHGYNPGEDEKVYEDFVNPAQRRAVWATRKDGGKGHPDNKKKKMKEEVEIDEASKGPMDPEKKAKSAIDTILKNHEEPAPEKGMKIGEEKEDDKMEPSTKHVKAALKVRAKPELDTKDIKSYHRNVLNKDLKEAEKEDVPFEGPYDKPAKKQPGQKSDPGYSTVRHLARQAMQKMLDKKQKMKEEVELDEGDVIPFPRKKKEEKPDTKPGWMLRKDPELAKKLEDAKARIKARKEAATQKEEVELDEVLKPSMGVKAYIDDFIKSDDPRFKGASKKERMKRALAAYYAAKKGDSQSKANLEEIFSTKRSRIHKSIGELVDHHVERQMRGKIGDAEFNNILSGVHKKIADTHGISHDEAKKHVNDYVEKKQNDAMDAARGGAPGAGGGY